MAPATATLPSPATLDRLLAFVTAIGLGVRETTLATDGFLPGVRIEDGVLLVDRARLQYPGDVLHEAGHLAVVPAAERPYVQADITAGHPERAGDELAVHPWSYAACLALNLPAEVVFHAGGYHGGGQWLADNYRAGTYIGLPLLAWMGLTTNESFPQMTRWTRE